MEYAQVFLGENLETLDDDQVITFQEYVADIARSGSAEAICKITDQGRIHNRNMRPKPAPRKRLRQRIPTTRRDLRLMLNKHHKIQNRFKIRRNLQSCNNISKQSMTLKYQITWETSSNENLHTIMKNFEIDMENAQVKDEMRNQLFQSTLGICVNSIRDPMNTDGTLKL